MPASTQSAWQAPPPQFQAAGMPPLVNPAAKAGRLALGWSLAGFFLCCFPLSIIGLVFGFRARKLAATQSAVPPATSTIGIALSAVGLANFLVFAIWFGLDQAALSDRVAELSAKVAAADMNRELSQQTACDMAELRVRTDGWKDDTPIVIDGFDCPGQVAQKESQAELPDFSFNTSSNGRVTVTVCYKRGARWTVKQFREGGGPCE
jgi:hypothetical protein